MLLSGVYSFRAWREQVWPSSCSQKPSSKCLFLLFGLSSSSSCSSASASRLCLATSREWWFLCRTSECCPEPGQRKFSVVIFRISCLIQNTFVFRNTSPGYMRVTSFFFCFSSSDLPNIFSFWAHIFPALWKLLASSFWQLCGLYPASGHRILWNVLCCLHLWHR